MGAKPKFSHYLVHQETGQRYAVGEEVVIGRAHGDIVFPDDPKLSSQHCRILRTPQGLGIHDLGSSNGTYVDGVRLDTDKVYALKTSGLISVGEQEFILQDAHAPRKKSASKKRSGNLRRQGGSDKMTVMAGLALVAAVIYFGQNLWENHARTREPKLEMLSPFQLMENEMKAAFADYKEMGRAKEAGEMSDKGLSSGIRKFLLPRLTAVYEKLGAIKPSGEFERRKLAADKKLVMALIEQCNAMAYFAETKSPKFEKDLERLSQVAAAAAEEVQKLDAARRPSNY
jgi:pSer/pThr/pTyr-binding forkhead associated (FHA) protein